MTASGLTFSFGRLSVDPDVPLEIGRGGARTVPGIEIHGNVSRLHARVESTPHGLLVTDLASTNGTYVNGERLPPSEPTAVRPGDRIRFAATLEAVVDDQEEP